MRIVATAFCLFCACSGSNTERAPTHENVAIAITFEGSYYWLGNELYEVSSWDDWRYGAFQHLRVAIEAASAELPTTAEVGIIAYDGANPRIALPMGPVRPRSSATLGQQRWYQENIGPDLALGIRMGMDELARSKARRKILLVVGSGGVSNSDAAPAALAALRAQAVRAHVETIAIVLPMELGTLEHVRTWTDNVVQVRSTWEIVERFRAMARDVRIQTASR